MTESSVERCLSRLRSLRLRHGLRAETLLPDLAFIGLVDDTIDAAEAALQLLQTDRPYRAYSMLRVAFEAAQRLLVLGSADDYIHVGTRAWLYYQAKDAALSVIENRTTSAAEEQFVSAWQSRFPGAVSTVLQERAHLARRKRGSPDNFLGENLAMAASRAYERIAAHRGTWVPPDTVEINNAVYQSLCRDTHACMRIEPTSIRIDAEGYVEIVSRRRESAEVESAVRTGLEACLAEAIAAVEFRLDRRQLALAASVKEQLSVAARTTRTDYLPDFGAFILGLDAGHSTMVFPGTPVKVLRGLADGALSCSVTTASNGVEYIATFDFRGDTRGKILELVREKYPGLAPALEEITKGTLIDMHEPLSCTLTAMLGPMQTSQDESFVPLVVVDIAGTQQ